MSSLLIRLDPTKLENPDADLRYAVPEILSERSSGAIVDDGYDYDDMGCLLLFLAAESEDACIALVREVLEGETVLGIDLSKSAQLAVGGPDSYRVVFPHASVGETLEVPE